MMTVSEPWPEAGRRGIKMEGMDATTGRQAGAGEGEVTKLRLAERLKKNRDQQMGRLGTTTTNVRR